MKEFVKPKKEIVSDSEYIQSLVNAQLIKDLHDDEEICEYCHGTGMVIANNSYGLSDDPNKIAGRFPYKHQAITFCPHCFGGVVHRCKYCGEIIEHGYSVHRCEKYKLEEESRMESNKKKALEEARIATPEELEKSEMFYSDNFSSNDGYFEDWEEFFEDWHENHDESEEKPKYVYCTYPKDFRIDAVSVAETYTSDLYEDALESLTDDELKELQKLLDDWCDRSSVSTTYYQASYKTKIPWELDNVLS